MYYGHFKKHSKHFLLHVSKYGFISQVLRIAITNVGLKHWFGVVSDFFFIHTVDQIEEEEATNM